MDYDSQLDYFNGKTAYEVSKEGYSKHLSQQWTWFTDWINGKNNEYTKATDIKKYSPLQYGLFYSNVGEDIEKNDMFENLVYYKTQEEKMALEAEQEQVQETQNMDNVIEENINIDVIANNKRTLLNWAIIGIIGIIILFVVIVKILKIIKRK